MGLLTNIRNFRDVTAQEHRVIGGVPWRPWDNPLWRFDTGGPVHPSRVFYGADAALGLPALYAGCKILADGAASLPIRVYQYYRDSGGQRRHRVYEGPSFFDKPSVTGTVFDWVFTGVVSLILHGNAWGLITGRDGYGFPSGIEWIAPEHVWVENDQRQPFNPLRTKVFVYGREMTWSGPDAELFHVKAFALPGRLEGLSLLRAFALTILAGHEAARYGTDWYRSGGFPPGTFRNKELEVDADQAAAIRAMLVSSLRRREPLVYGRDWDYTPVTVPPSEAQFLEAGQVNACTVGGARFTLSDGSLRRADRLTAGDEILSWDGTRLTRGTVQAIAPMPPGPVLRVRTQCGRELTTTVNHPYWASGDLRTPGGRSNGTLDGNARWKRADELKPGDYVRVALDWDSDGDFDPECAWALGALTGNGYLPATGRPKFTSADANTVIRLDAWARAHGGTLVPCGPRQPYDFRVNTGPGSAGDSPQLRRELHDWGVLGVTAERKRVPGCVMTGGRKAQAAFLSGYLDTDGTVVAEGRPQPIVAWTSVSRELLEQCQHLLMLLGVQSTVRFHEAAHDKLIMGTWRKTRDTWTLLVCGRANVRHLAGLLELTHPVKAARLAWWGAAQARRNGARSDTRWTRVTAVQDAGEQETLAVQVSGTHTHVTEGLVTHNTQIAAILNLPPERLGGKPGASLTYSNHEQAALQVLEALRPWLTRLEMAFSDLLPRNRFVRFWTDALLKTDLETRVKIYETQRNVGLATADEIREREDLPPFPGGAGDEPMPLQLMTALGQRAGALPKSMESQVVFLMDHAAATLEKLKETDPSLVQPVTGSSALPDPAGLLGSMFTTYARSLARDPVRGWDEDTLFLRQLGDRARATTSPEYVGAWIPDAREHVNGRTDEHES